MIWKNITESEFENENNDTCIFSELIRNMEKQNIMIEEQNNDLITIINELDEYKKLLTETLKEKLKKEDKPEFVKVLLKLKSKT